VPAVAPTIFLYRSEDSYSSDWRLGSPGSEVECV